jgi:hypothetical protein
LDRSIRFFVRDSEPILEMTEKPMTAREPLTARDRMMQHKKPTPIGYCVVPVRVAGAARNLSLGLIPANTQAARAGELIIRAGDLVEKLTFFMHIKKGLRFNFACAIDFAATNRPPSDPKSLHYLRFKHSNVYERIIESIGSVVEQYSIKQVCHAWGFAAKLNRQLSQTIPLLTETGDSDLVGVHQLLASYTALIEKLHFDQPVAIVPSTQEVLKQIQKNTELSEYSVFLILLQDDPVDLAAFVMLVWDHQHDPISILIFGLGNATFQQLLGRFKMGATHRDENGRTFERDVVRFLRYNEWGQDNECQMISTALSHLQQEAIGWFEDISGMTS